MSDQAWKVLAGAVIVALAIFAVLQFGHMGRKKAFRQDSGDATVTETQQSTNSPSKPMSMQRAEQQIDIVQAEQVAESDIEAMATEQEGLAPLEQDARLYAKATANMGITQIRALQQSRQGVIVRDINGHLIPPYAERELCNANKKCKTIITNTKTGVTVWDGSWKGGIHPTGIGKEVVKK